MFVTCAWPWYFLDTFTIEIARIPVTIAEPKLVHLFRPVLLQHTKVCVLKASVLYNSMPQSELVLWFFKLFHGKCMFQEKRPSVQYHFPPQTWGEWLVQSSWCRGAKHRSQSPRQLGTALSRNFGPVSCRIWFLHLSFSRLCILTCHL